LNYACSLSKSGKAHFPNNNDECCAFICESPARIRVCARLAVRLGQNKFSWVTHAGRFVKNLDANRIDQTMVKITNKIVYALGKRLSLIFSKTNKASDGGYCRRSNDTAGSQPGANDPVDFLIRQHGRTGLNAAAPQAGNHSADVGVPDRISPFGIYS